MIGLMDKAMEINYILRTNFPSSCRIWEPIYSGNHIRFRVKCKNVPVLCVELTDEQVMNFFRKLCGIIIDGKFHKTAVRKD